MLTPQDFINAAKLIGCQVAAIQAVTQQEAGGRGFYSDGKVIIKFEGHVFHHLTAGKFDVIHPTLSYPAWTEKYSPVHSEDQYIRFNAAFDLDTNAAMEATSWGMFQIVGENFSDCGFKSISEFVNAMHKDEAAQLDAFCMYVRSEGLAHYLVNMALPGQCLLNAAGFARRYNGSGYKVNHYDTNIANTFTKLRTAA